MDETKKPVLLVLHAYQPVIWRLDVTADANIAGIQLYGHYEQMIEGLPAGVPVGRKIADFNWKNEDPYCAETLTTADELAVMQNAKTRISTTINRETQRLNRAVIQLYAPSDSHTEAEQSGELSEHAAYQQEVIDDATKLLLEAKAALHSLNNALSSFFKKSANYLPHLSLDEMLPQKEFLEQLSNRGAFKVVSYQTIGGHWNAELKWVVEPVVISSAAAATYAARKAEGKRILANLEMPNIRVRPKDSPRKGDPTMLIPSNGLRGVALVKDLLAEGYLRHATVARDFACLKRKGAFMAEGFTPPRKDQCVGQWSSRHPEKHLTILGPIAFPSGLCGGYSIDFFLPPDVPEPTGNPCHSKLIRLEAEPCLEDGSSCWRDR